jgi:adenylate cyclase
LVAVMPFANRSGDAEQSYFSDGITEDVITDLGKVSALRVIARNTVFALRNETSDARQFARRLGATHIVEGSIRRSEKSIRVTATLVDGATGHQLWAERYDRSPQDIFALQDEISRAIVDALKLKLLPEERRAIQRRGTTNVEAFNLYLMARQRKVWTNMTSAENSDMVVRLCRRAVELDPAYARAWALMATALALGRYGSGQGERGLAAAERAIALDDAIAEAHAARGAILSQTGEFDEARLELESALRLDPDSYEANTAAGRLCFRQGQFREAIGFWEKAWSAIEDDFSSVGMLTTCYAAIGDVEGARSAARRTLAATERVLARDPSNGSAISMMIGALACLGETDRAKTWIERALLLDPDNMNMRYNIACALIQELKEVESGLDVLAPALAAFTSDRLAHALIDPDLDSVRDHLRFIDMIEAAKTRLASERTRDE